MQHRAAKHEINKLAFEGRNAVVTGGAQGIGYSIAERLLASGARIAIWDIHAQKADEACAELCGRFGSHSAKPFAVDIGSLDSVRSAADATLAAVGTIDVLINNAGIVGPNHPLTDYPEDAWSQVIDVNINGTFYCCKAIVPVMIDQAYGRIVNVASIAGKEGNPNASAYSASKAGIIALTKSLGKELADKDIAVNCVTPAVAATPGAMEQSPSHIEYMLSKIPRGRFLELHEASAMICWLASAENSFTTGAVFDLSGGRATY